MQVEVDVSELLDRKWVASARQGTQKSSAESFLQPEYVLKEAYESARSRCGEGSPGRGLSKGQRHEVSPGISRQNEVGDPPRGQGHSKELFLIVKEMCSRKFIFALQRNHIGSIDKLYQLQNL